MGTKIIECDCGNGIEKGDDFTGDITLCWECCDHEDTMDILGGEQCEDCGSLL